MRIAVAGSIATDILMTFPGRFKDQFLEEQMHKVSLSFLVDELVVHRGGVGANICYGMAQLGQSSLLVGSVGADFAEYGAALTAAGVDVSHVRVCENVHTARFTCTTDLDANQIASFYTGAMAEARELDLAAIHAKTGGIDLVLIGADDPEGMLKHTDLAKAHGIAVAADPSQQLARMEGAEIRRLVDGATYLFSNEYEAGLMAQKTGWSHEEILERVGVRVTTHGGDGVVIENTGGILAKVPAVPAPGLVDPTGGGDAFRAGYLTGRAADLDHEAAAQIGCTLATTVLETVGTQEYTLDRAAFLDRLESAYGSDAAATADGALKSA
ncbi:carbohydrate kinase family protein [Kribbella pittospori]|uniref:Carbohydrate kinase family protein n=1 Tax=Kribbella pittospori TaxID=722689 RepID=A0A4R0KXJ8_9ACTN|nr:carbohydrate kinase family protein [Kribbella pittospori]TCC65833.1 carbohydrate kinase family protein [Kribbella pittospori]